MVILANDEQIRSVTLRTLNNGFPGSHPNASITVPLPSLDKQAKESLHDSLISFYGVQFIPQLGSTRRFHGSLESNR
ncbi:unnamed protein product, partial [Mesorhabditis belari]|uniref:Uncharacterized protein n=1 Tax=Mesorhabditis belari TaxID=2138241 RepID=A0AAF3F5B2_9BILA